MSEPRRTCPQDSPLIAFARRSPHPAANRLFGNFSLNWRIAALWIVALLFMMAVGRYPLALIAVLTAIGGAALIYTVVFVIKARQAGEWSRVPEFPEPSARVACVGSSRNLKKLSDHGPLIDEFAEPYACLTPFALRTPEGAAFLGVAVAGVVTVVLLYFSNWTTNGYLCMMAGVFSGAFVAATAWPTYIRVAPGRLDVIELGFLGRGVKRRESFDLRSNAVLIDVDKYTLYLADVHGRTEEILIRSAADPHALSAAILRAAISTHTPPPLPEDELLG